MKKHVAIHMLICSHLLGAASSTHHIQQLWHTFKTAQTRMLSSSTNSATSPINELIQTLRNGEKRNDDTPLIKIIQEIDYLENKDRVRSEQILQTARLLLQHGADPNHEQSNHNFPINPCPHDRTMIHTATPFAEVFAHFTISFFPHHTYDSSPKRPIFWRMMKLLREYATHPIIKRAVPYGPFPAHPSISRRVLAARIETEMCGTKEAMVDEIMEILQAPPLQPDTFLRNVDEHLKPENKEEFQEAIEFFRSWQEEWVKQNSEHISDRVCEA